MDGKTGNARPGEIDLLALLSALWRGRAWIFAMALVGLTTGSFYGFRIAQPVYQSDVRLVLQMRAQNVVDVESVVSGISSDQAALNTELELAVARSLIETLVRELDLTEDNEFNPALQVPRLLSADGIRARLARYFPDIAARPLTKDQQFIATTRRVAAAVSATGERNTYLFIISARSHDRAKAARLANRLAELYVAAQVDAKFAATSYASSWLSDRVAELETDLNKKEDEINGLMAKSAMIDEESHLALTLRVKETRQRLDDSKEAMARLEADLKLLSEPDARPEALSALLEDAMLRRHALGAEAGDAPAVAAFEARLTALRSERERQLRRQKEQYDSLQASLADLALQVEEQNQDIMQLTLLERQAQASRVLYETLLARLKETSVQVGLHQADARILSPAITGRHVAPRKSVIMAICALIGAISGAIIAAIRQMGYAGFRTPQELEDATGVDVIGQVPLFPLRRRRGLVKFLQDNPTDGAIEAVRNLRTSLIMRSSGEGCRVVLLTSSIPGEGKTTVAISLAQNLAGLSGRVLLLEGDIRRRTFGQYFGTLQGGLGDVISGKCALVDAIRPDVMKGVDILAGSAAGMNAADLFASKPFFGLMKDLRARYDHIVIDTPPVLAVPDARLLAQHADDILYIVGWNQARRMVVSEGLRLMRSTGLEITGLTLSKINQRRMRGYGYETYRYGRRY